jgi:hypothetical protein
VQPIAAWLVARPMNGVVGLATTLLIPFPFSLPLSGLLIAHLVLALGVRQAVIEGLAAGAVLVLVAFLVKASASQIVASAVITWVPVIMLAGLARKWRSVTLTMQVSVILATFGVLAFFVVHGDPSTFWNDVVTDSMTMFRDVGASAYADWLENSRAVIVPQMSMLFVFIGWSMYTLALFLGYGLFQSLPGKVAIFGRFCDLNLGRVLAMILAVGSVLAVVTGAVWLRNVALMIFIVFWLQGLAILHWLRAEKSLPTIVLITTYAFMVPLLVLIMMTLAILGYLDAWFNFRARGVTKQT